jgi:hypothetical protein
MHIHRPGDDGAEETVGHGDDRTAV